MSIVYIIYSPIGAGKSTLAKRLAAETGAVHFSIDEWMHYLFSADEPEQLNLDWVLLRVNRCETLIWQVCLPILKTGADVILDLGFLTIEKRQYFRKLALDAGFQFINHFIDANQHQRRERVIERNKMKGETYSFEVTNEMFDWADAAFQWPADIELKECTHA